MKKITTLVAAAGLALAGLFVAAPAEAAGKGSCFVYTWNVEQRVITSYEPLTYEWVLVGTGSGTEVPNTEWFLKYPVTGKTPCGK